MRRGIVAGGNFIRDRIKTVDVYPHEEALANILSESSSNGGGAYNLLLDLAKLDPSLPLSAIGRVGEDADGDAILAECRAALIDTSQLHKTTGMATSYTDVMSVQSTGRRTFFHQRGANAQLRPEDFDFEGTTAQHFHLAYLLLLDGLDQPDAEYGTAAARVLATAKGAGLTTSVDVVSEASHRFPALVIPALKYADVVFMNEFEAERTSGLPLLKDGNVCEELADAAARRLLDFGNSEVIAIHCADRSFAWSRAGGMAALGRVSLTENLVVSAVGAGDAFAAGFLLAYTGGLKDLDALLRNAASAAAACVTGSGCSDGLMSITLCLALGKKFGYLPL